MRSWWVLAVLAGCGSGAGTAQPTDTDTDTDTDADADADADTDADVDTGTTGTPPTGDTATTATTGDTGSPLCLDSDGDGVADVAELAVTSTDPAVFDGGCLPWTHVVVDRNVPSMGDDFVLGDVDSDGDLDVLASEENATLFWYENTGGGFSNEIPIYNQRVWVPYYGYRYTVQAGGETVADLDGDGVNDLVYTGDHLSVLRGLGAGRFATPAVDVATVAYKGPVWPADLDGDGDADLVTWNGFHELAWYENTGGFGFAYHSIDSRDWQVAAPDDVDGDGDLDLVYLLTYWYGDLGWYENLGGGSGWTNHPIGAFGDEGRSLAVGDFDGDGDADVAATGNDVHGPFVYELRLWTHDAGVTFTGPAGVAQQTLVAAGDVDGDGDADLVSSGTGGLSWWVSEGGTLRRRPIGTRGAEALHLGDVDGDGALDVATEPGVDLYRNPLRDDTDGDGLTDDAEGCILHTSPAAPDTDGDGFGDGEEVCRATDPGDAAVHP